MFSLRRLPRSLASTVLLVTALGCTVPTPTAPIPHEPFALGTYRLVSQEGFGLPVRAHAAAEQWFEPRPAAGRCHALSDSARITIDSAAFEIAWSGRLLCTHPDESDEDRRVTLSPMDYRERFTILAWDAIGFLMTKGDSTTVYPICVSTDPFKNRCPYTTMERIRLEFGIRMRAIGDTLIVGEEGLGWEASLRHEDTRLVESLRGPDVPRPSIFRRIAP